MSYSDVNEFPNFSGLKGVLKKLRFGDGLVWTVSLTVEINSAFFNLRL